MKKEYRALGYILTGFGLDASTYLFDYNYDLLYDAIFFAGTGMVAWNAKTLYNKFVTVKQGKNTDYKL